MAAHTDRHPENDQPRRAAHQGDAATPSSDPPPIARDSDRTANLPVDHQLIRAGETNYPPPARAATRGELRIEFPPDAPTLTPGAARVLLRILLTATDRQTATTPPDPPERTP